MDYTKDIRAYIALEQQILGQLDVDAINECLNFLDETRLKKGRIYKWQRKAISVPPPVL